MYLCHALGLLYLITSLKGSSNCFTKALEQKFQELLVFVVSCKLMGHYDGDEINLCALRLKSNSQLTIVVILAEVKMTINLKIPAKEAFELLFCK